MATLYHQLHIKAPQDVVYNAVATPDGIASWWDRPVAVQENGETILEFRPGEGHGVLKMKVLALVPCEKVEWECISTHLKSSPASAWTGTRVVFAVEGRGGVSVLNFRHIGWDESSEYFGFCNYHWGEALQKLQHVCQTKCS